MKKAIFFDIDGTLIDFKGTMPDSTKQALDTAKKNGHHIVLCTGRSKAQIPASLLQYEFNGIIASSGAYVEMNNIPVCKHYLSKKQLSFLIKTMEDVSASYILQTDGQVLTTKKSLKDMKDKFKQRGFDPEDIDYMQEKMLILEQVQDREDVHKLVYLDAKYDVVYMKYILESNFEITAFSYEKSYIYSGEITGKGINKAYGISKYIEHAGILKENTIAFGDGDNDREMINYVQIGIAMGNAIASLKQEADYITKDIDHNGIYFAMKKFGII